MAHASSERIVATVSDRATLDVLVGWLGSGLGLLVGAVVDFARWLT
jgi:hypothetical protein